MNFDYQTCYYCQHNLVLRNSGDLKKTCLNCLDLYQVLIQYVAYLDEVWMEISFYDSEERQIKTFSIFEDDRSNIVIYSQPGELKLWQQILTGHKLIREFLLYKNPTLPYSITACLHPSNVAKTIRNYLLLA